MSNSTICVQNLHVFYGSTHALKNINIDVPDKQITAIIGPSGCGKTTLLKCLNRLIEPSDEIKISGQVIINGEDIYHPKAEVTHIRKKMGLLSQKPYPLPMSIFENVAFGPKIHGMKNKNQLKEIVKYYLKEANLWDEVKDRLHSPASMLSIGQQQRLCLARGLAVQPEFILGDEPTSALDPQSSSFIEKRFLELKNKYGIVLVTHILRQAKRIADYIIYLYEGEILEHGPADEILTHPKHPKTIEYVQGIIN